jgi:peptidoglycan/xylan/chitin deacetylase (PgdA/CDA1 family)
VGELPVGRSASAPGAPAAGAPVVTTSWDDGHPCDRKLADLLADCGVAGTFYIPIGYSSRAVLDAEGIRALARGFEIGGHSLSHPRLHRIERARLLPEIAGCKQSLEEIIGRPVTTFCYPYGKYSRRVRQAVIEAGFTGARTTRQFRLDVGNDPWSMGTTIAAFDLPSWLRTRYFVRTADIGGMLTFIRAGVARSWLQLAMTLFDMALERGGVWHLWGHSWQVEDNNLWADLRTLLKYVGGRRGVGYLTNAEVLQAMRSR